MDFSWSEMLLVGIVALIVIGPKDLPGMFRELGRFTAKLRSMGREFSRAMDAAAKESGVKDVADDLRKVTSPKAMGLDAVRSAADKFEKWDPLKPMDAKPPAAKPALGPGVVAAPATSAPAGPATAALAETVAARKVAAAEKAAALLESRTQPPAASQIAVAQTAEEVPAAPKRGGRVRKKPEGDVA